MRPVVGPNHDQTAPCGQGIPQRCGSLAKVFSLLADRPQGRDVPVNLGPGAVAGGLGVERLVLRTKRLFVGLPICLLVPLAVGYRCRNGELFRAKRRRRRCFIGARLDRIRLVRCAPRGYGAARSRRGIGGINGHGSTRLS